jgi:hypothetical protein
MKTTPLQLCLGCGAWQETTAACRNCNSERLISATSVGGVDQRTGTKINGSAVRILLDIEARSDGMVRATRLYTNRLAPIRHDKSLLSTLDSEVRTHLSGRTMTPAAWAGLHAASCGHVTDAVVRLLRPRWPGNPRISQVPVELSFRLLNLNPAARAPAEEFPWLEVIALDAAVAQAATSLKSGDVKANRYGTVLSLDDGGDRLQFGLRVPVEALVADVVLCSKVNPSEVLAKFDVSTFLARDRLTPVVDARLPAPVLWRLSPQREDLLAAAELKAHFHGLEKPIRVEIPCGDLGRRETLVDVFLDLGSTTTKYIIRVGDELSTPQMKRTARLTDEWSLPRYNKAKFLDDGTGAEWSNWITELLPALRRYAARTHRGHLRSVHLTVPQSGLLDVAALSRAIAARKTTTFSETRRLDDDALRVLVERASVDAVGFEVGGQVVVLTPEHEAVARHYLAPLGVLRKVASSYHQTYSDHEANRSYQTKQRSDWDRKRAEQKKYDDRSFLWRVFHNRPAGPTGACPGVESAIESPAAWMKRLVDKPELLDRIVLLDAGGLSLDIAVFESNVLVPVCSKSDATCGGEAVTREFAKLLGVALNTLEDGTREKAGLGDRWTNSANTTALSWDERFGRFGGRRQKAYKDSTQTIYSPAVVDLANALAKRWRSDGSSRCTILLTGGGSQNPHFQELVAGHIAEVGLEADVVDARKLQDLLDEARSFKHPLSDLASPSVNLFTTTHGWALDEVQGSERMAYDKYAVVGGLLAGAQKP